MFWESYRREETKRVGLDDIWTRFASDFSQSRVLIVLAWRDH